MMGMDAPSYRPGCPEDFDRLYRDSYRHLLYTLLAVLRNHAAAEDCVQETFVRAFAAWSRWKPDAPAEAWLHRIALRIASSHRRHERLRDVGETLRRLGRPATDTGIEDLALGLDLVAALRRLPPQQSFVIMMRHHHGYSNRQIATALKLPESTVASRLAAAKAGLRAALPASTVVDLVPAPGRVVGSAS
jgi:RNA polymerase sigma factor (sigma-70 family)